jgi:DNA-binding NtrC family response regulator
MTGREQSERLDESTWEGFSLKQHVRQSERSVIERALRDARGSVTIAARLLGMSHQSLIYLINTRHKNLLNARSAVRRRRRQISLKRKGTKRIRKSPKQIARQISILHVEDHRMVANLVGDILTEEGWRVDLCMDGDSALRKLTGNDRYDVLVVDNNLPGLSGLELVQRARLISHRRRTPIIMLSGDDVEKEAWRAGVDDFVRKPEAGRQLVSAITRLLQKWNESTEMKATKA